MADNDDNSENGQGGATGPNHINIDWNQQLAEYKENYFLKHEVKRLMQINDGLEWRMQLAYAFGYGDGTAGIEFDSEFCVENIELDQDADWTEDTNDDIVSHDDNNIHLDNDDISYDDDHDHDGD